MRKNRMLIVIAILLMSIGFAAVATNLFINGNILIGTNEEDFDVYFSKAIVDGVDESSKVISSDGKSITFVTKNLKSVGETSILDYVVTNNSTQYDADVEVTCTPNETEYFSITNQINDVVKAQSEESGKTTVTLNKKTLEEQKITFTCTIIAQAIEREITIGKDETNTYSLGGYLVDSNNEIQPNQSLVVYSNTPHYVMTDLTGYFYVDGLEKGSHEVFYMGNMLIEELKNKTKAEIETSALKKLNITTSSTSAKFDDQLLIKDFVINKTNDIKVVSLNVDDKSYNKIITDEEEVSFKVDKTNESTWTNIAASNSAIPSYNNGVVTISNVTGNTNVYLNKNLNNTVDVVDNTKNNIVMLTDEVITSQISIDKTKNINLELNGLNLDVNLGDTENFITNYGKIKITDKNKKSQINTSGTLFKNYGQLIIENGNYTNNDTSTKVPLVEVLNGKLEMKNAKLVQANGILLDVNADASSVLITNSDLSVIGSDYTIINRKNSEINIYDSFVDNKKGQTIYNGGAGSINIYDGIYTSESGASTVNNMGNGSINIYGGKFISNAAGVTIRNGGSGDIYIGDEYSSVYIINKIFDESLSLSGPKTIMNIKTGNIKIKGHIADKCLPNEYNNTGICVYSNYRAILNEDTASGKVEVYGAYVVSEYTSAISGFDNELVIDNVVAVSKNASAVANSSTKYSVERGITGKLTIKSNLGKTYLLSTSQEYSPAVNNWGLSDIIIDGQTANACTKNINDTNSGLCIYAEGDKNYINGTANTGVSNSNTGKLYLLGGTIYGGNRGINNNGSGTIYITGGEINSSNIGIFNNSTGVINICNGKTRGKTDLYNNSTGTINYSQKTLFTDNTNIPILYNPSGKILGNYDGTCGV